MILKTLLAALLLTTAVHAEGPSARIFTVPEAVEYAAQHYPAVRAAIERRNAARASVSLARDIYLPHADAIWQLNRATRNNVAGVLLPQSTIPNPSGSVVDTSTQSFWGTGSGMQLSWEPFDFGYRSAQVETARATERRTADQIQVTLLDAETAAADAALSVLAAEQNERATQADIDRRTALTRSVHALVDARLRPGADASRADAELAAARTQQILARENAAVARARLAELLGLAGVEVEVAPGGLLHSATGSSGPEPVTLPPVSPATHPAALVETDRIAEIQSRIHQLDRSYVPKFNLQAIGYGRGTGVKGNGKPAADSNQGLTPDTPNWAAGITVHFALFDFASIHSRKQVELANRRREEQLYTQTIENITGRSVRARERLEGAVQVAANTPFELAAARQTEAQARARFQAGVATLVDVAEAQRLLVTADIDNSLAALTIWRDIERLTSAEGNLQPFLDLVQQADAAAPPGVR